MTISTTINEKIEIFKKMKEVEKTNTIYQCSGGWYYELNSWKSKFPRTQITDTFKIDAIISDLKNLSYGMLNNKYPNNELDEIINYYTVRKLTGKV